MVVFCQRRRYRSLSDVSSCDVEIRVGGAKRNERFLGGFTIKKMRPTCEIKLIHVFTQLCSP